jgi:hypothetical protein
MVSLQVDFHNQVSSDLQASEQRCQFLSDDVAGFQRFCQDLNDVVSLLIQGQEAGASAPSSSPSLSSLASCVEHLELSQASPSSHSLGEFATIQCQLKLLKARIPPNFLRKGGGCTFNSKADLMLFIEEKMVSSISFSNFHDAVSLLEALRESFMERKDVISEWYQSTKVGLSEAEASTMASLKIVLPTVFGLIKEGEKTS